MTELYYNSSLDGIGLPGLLNYTNNLVNGYFGTAFLVMIWIVIFFVGSKSEWRMSNVITTTFFITFVTAMILSIIITINSQVMWILGIGIAIGIFWMMIEGKRG
jgi:uncharacterized membrane protein